MKRRDLLSACLDAVLAWVLAIAGAGCLTTGLGLTADMTAVMLTALGFAILAVLVPRLRRGWIWLLLTLVLGAQLLWELQFAENFYPQLKQALTYYNKAYGWGVPEWLEEYEAWDATLTVCAITAVCALLAGISLSKNWFIGVLLSLVLPVIPCILVTNTVPEALYFWLGLVAMAVVILTWNSRRMDTRQANRLTAMVLIPAILASMLLFVRNPQSEYEAPGRDAGVFLLMRKLASHLPFMNMTPAGSGELSVQSSLVVDLTTAGPRNQPSATVMEVVASHSGVVYLRGRNYDAYTGLNWMASAGQQTLSLPAREYLLSTTQTMRIHTQYLQDLQHIPYYLQTPVQLEQGLLPNEVARDFVYSFLPLRADWKILWHRNHSGMTLGDMERYTAENVQAMYLTLPQQTALQAQYHLQQAGISGDDYFVYDAVEAIRKYVQNAAEYDLDTGFVPEWETDFAMWFLENSDTGYCVHFATAAAVLLRAAGIPARYVEGYIVETRSATTVAVATENAHAWVEYYLPDVGWVILEATPAGGLPVTLPPEPTLPPETEPTEPTQPTQPTEPTEPTQPTEPTEPTVPTEPTGPTGPTKPTVPTDPTEPTAPTQPSGTEPVQTTSPEASEPDGDPDLTQDRSGLWKLLGWIGLALAAVLLVILQWCLRLWLRHRKMAGKAWEQVRARWRYACLLAKLCRHRPPPALEALAMKAKFSQHTLSARELRQFSRYYAACIRGLRKHPWPLRLVYRLILAAW